MLLAPGICLGPYKIVSPLGAGGMGEVYRARDTRLRRDVALKILPADVYEDSARRARFEEEARAAAALNHPNILSVHDVGRDQDVLYIASELVDGETLSTLIQRGPVPVRALLDIAVQIADGLACAHAAGIVHRDLKPANVMVANDRRVKILDFGLAKQRRAPGDGGDETGMVAHTEPGMIVGTVNYMSPEQARGTPVDHRSDQFSFGLLLYEMASGKKAFDKPASVQTMSAIISEDPAPIDARQPAPLRWAIDRCLAKDPAGRYESSRDLFYDLRNLRDNLSDVSTQTATEVRSEFAPPRRRRWQLPASFALGAIVVLAFGLFRGSATMPDQAAYRFTPFSFEPGGQTSAVWSPDGKAIAYAARQRPSDAYQVFVRYLDAAVGRRLTDLKDPAFPVAWSPDSKRILFIGTGPQPRIFSVATVGGEPEAIMALPTGLDDPLDPYVVTISPDNNAVAVLAQPANDVLQLLISSPPGSPAKRYAPAPFETKEVRNSPMVRFSPDGRRLIVMVNAARAGEEAWLLDYPSTGAAGARRVLPDLPRFSTPWIAWMPDSRHVVLSLQSTAESVSQLWMADVESGERHALTSGTTARSTGAVAPDGNRLILAERTENYDVISVDLATAAARTVIATERNELMPMWAAAERTLVYVSDRNGPNEIWLRQSDDADRPLVTARDFETPTLWFMGPALSPRGDRVIYLRIEGKQSAGLWISSVAGGTPIQLTNDTVAKLPGAWSPDGAWFVYPTMEGGRVNLMKVKTTGQATPILLRADVDLKGVPAWSPTGNWIANGSNLISPDGTTTKSLGDHNSPHYVFSQDGKLLYGLRAEKDAQLLFSIDLASGRERIIGEVSRDLLPATTLTPSIRFSLAPDGKSLIYASGQWKTNFWILGGFNPGNPRFPFSVFSQRR
jgi:eukaryotic-like serine/threonine-protein kinase